tara:strand:- start:124 stop:390 length:267 start_codon:yes stop_codon:yes gene_type:complete
MKVGDMVIRAYAWHAIIPGIIVEEEIEVYTTNDERESYELCHFVVQWSDGIQTKEMYEELDTFLDNPHIENIINNPNSKDGRWQRKVI